MREVHCAAVGVFLLGLAGAASANPYFEAVKAYADAMVEQGRDRYGPEPSPLFATTLNREAAALLEGDALEAVMNIERESWGIRNHDRMVTGANPMHDQNLYQILYALTRITGDDRYAKEADRALGWFLGHCQSETTGLLAWGEHIGWDFHTETLIDKGAGTTHEYYRPWVLWARCFALDRTAAARFAEGVWLHQIGNHDTGAFSRHARYDQHATGTDSEYPRHGGFYILTWAHAYAQTHDPTFLKAIETVLTYFESRRSPVSGAIPAESAARSEGKMVWPPSNVSLAVDLWDSAKHVPDPLATAMRASAEKTDKVFLAIAHDLEPGGAGFVTVCDTDTLGAGDPRGGAHRTHSRLWATGYGDQTDAQMANLCMLRYRQTKEPGYRDLVVKTAQRYLASDVDTSFPVYPGTLGDAIWLMLDAHTLTGDAVYRDRAVHFADVALGMFLDGAPLPQASSAHGHYEAVTRGDTLMMSLLRLSQTDGTNPDSDLVYTDR